ncbi:MAG: tetratricopeptide repeat protein, partial [Bryobacteraceae bacterium]|nr:tetratricopeptide repeat protein [Bryobacteraceae bacterium]MDW8380453.1 tetratricopeptide repeat protein [Bryobacterales bacterium]
MMARRLWSLCLLVGALQAAPQPSSKSPNQDDAKKARDLKYEVLEDVDTPVAGKVVLPRSYAVVIGVSQYPKLDSSLQLKFTERDAEAMYSVLISREGGNFPPQNVRKLTGAKATLANIRDAIEVWLPSVAKDDDRVLIYFAGHGFVYRGKVYLAPSDFNSKDPAGTGYSTESLGAAFGSKIRGKWKVLLTDSCHSGAAVSDTDSQVINSRLLDLNRSLFSLTASRDRERSFESPQWGGGHGIFTYYVVKGLEGEADESKDGMITADELAAYVQQNVRLATKGQQNPMVGGSFDNSMLLAFNPAGAKLSNPPPPKTGTLIFESSMDNVEVFLDGRSVGVVHRGQPLRLPGILPGPHQVKGVRMGYEPDGPREEMVYPGQESTITFKFLIPRRRPKAALDQFDDAVKEYLRSKGPEDYQRAVAAFHQVLKLDPTYSQAALYLARAYRDLHQPEEAKKWFQKALQLDPDYLEARATYGGMLFDLGDVDEAIRELNRVVQRDPNHATAQYLLAQAFRLKGMYDAAIEAARAAIRLTPENGEAYFWFAEALRMKGQYADAIQAYQQYLKLTNYESGLARKIAHYSFGFKGLLTKKRAATTDVWKELRKLTYFGLCDCERKLNRFQYAIAFCQKALSFDAQDEFTHYLLALCYAGQARET